MRTELENFLRALKLRVSQTTYIRKEWQIKSFYKYLLYHNIDYTQVNKETVEKYLQTLTCCISSKRQLCNVIGEFFNFLNIDNPVHEITFKKDIRKKLPKVPSQVVIERIISTMSVEQTILSFMNRLIVELAYGSGLRRLELVKLNIDDVDLENRTVYVQGKGGRNRIVPITEKTVESMREYLAERKCWIGPLLVSYMGKRLTVTGLYQITKRKHNIRPHQLRHACAGHMLKNGCSIRVIQELLGHKKLSATQIYTQISKDNLREVINQKHPRKL